MTSAEPQAPEFNPLKMVSTFLPFIILWGFNKLDLPKDDPVVLWSIRAIYITSVLVNFALVYVLEQKIKANKDKNNQTLIYVVKNSNKSPMSQDSNVDDYEYKVEKAWEYDLAQVQAMKSWTGPALTLGLHFYFGFLPALVIQTITGPMRFFESKITHMYFFGAAAPERPFAVDPSPFAALLGQKSEKELMDEWDAEQTKKGKRPSGKDQPKQVENKKKEQKKDTSSEEEEDSGAASSPAASPTNKKKAKKID